MSDPETIALAKAVFRQYQEKKVQHWKKQLAIHQKFLFNSRAAATPDPDKDTALSDVLKKLDRTEESLIRTVIEQDPAFATAVACASVADGAVAALVNAKTANSTFYQKLLSAYKVCCCRVVVLCVVCRVLCRVGWVF